MRRCLLYVFVLLLVRVPCLWEHRCVLFFVSRAQACLLLNGHCLSPGAVLPVKSQVFISLDSGRRITRPKAATHPSFVGLSKRALNVRCCSSSPLQLHKPDFQLLSFGWSVCAADVLVRNTRDDGGVACIVRNTTFFTSNTSYCLSAELNDTLLWVHFQWCTACRLKVVSLVFGDLWMFLCVWPECLVMKGIGEK